MASVITIGNFDGQHLGHARLFGMVKDAARRRGLQSTALSFHPHPSWVLGTPKQLITSYDERRANVAASGVDRFVEVNFDKDFAGMNPEEFMRFLAADMGCKELVIGDDYRFGKGATGRFEDYQDLAIALDMVVNVANAVEIEGTRVSSSAIRKFIRDTDFKMAARFLGRPFAVTGTVSRGMQRGRRLGFPTANVTPPPEKLLPPDGVYYTKIWIKDQLLRGITNVGTNPTFTGQNGPGRTVESHVFNFNDDIVGEMIRVDIVKFIRPERKFASGEELVRQIEKDVESCGDDSDDTQ